MTKQISIYLFAVILLTSSCVSKKKYDELFSSSSDMKKELMALKRAKKDCDKMAKEYEALKQQFKEVSEAKEGLAMDLKNLTQAKDDLMSSYDKLLDQNSTIISSSSEEKEQLNQALAQKEAELNRKERQLSKAQKEVSRKESELQSMQSELADLEQSLQEREARIASLTDQLNAQKRGLQQLKAQLTDALLGFSAADLTVTQKNGKVYVSMSQNLLFAKGSDVIDTKGRDAIKKVAEVLAGSPDIDIMVEGHTDTDGTAERNWDLSVTRATSVVKLMTKFGVNPKHLTAAGRGFYLPVAPNDNEANKSKNRRTEIILSPKLDELMNILQS